MDNMADMDDRGLEGLRRNQREIDRQRKDETSALVMQMLGALGACVITANTLALLSMQAPDWQLDFTKPFPQCELDPEDSWLTCEGRIARLAGRVIVHWIMVGVALWPGLEPSDQWPGREQRYRLWLKLMVVAGGATGHVASDVATIVVVTMPIVVDLILMLLIVLDVLSPAV